MTFILNDYIDSQEKEILQSALRAVDPFTLVQDCVEFGDGILSIAGCNLGLHKNGKIYVVGLGKAVVPMAAGLLERLPRRITAGTLVPKHISKLQASELPAYMRIVLGNHPIPAHGSVTAAREVLAMLQATREQDVVIGLISGGGSSLVTLPKNLLTIDQINTVTGLLLKSGSDIIEINTIRKHLDDVKGGGLLNHIQPAFSANLILSDVIGDDISAIASGPTSPDATTFADALNIINKYRLTADIDNDILSVLRKGARGDIFETLKEDNPLFLRTCNKIIGSLRSAMWEGKKQAEFLGFEVELYSPALEGEASEVGRSLGAYLAERAGKRRGHVKPLCIMAGGETTVTIKGKGKGGRNLEVALGAALALAGLDNLKIITLATDGEDGPTDAAGAVVDGRTVSEAREIGLDAMSCLAANDTYNFFNRTGRLIKTGPTGTNVNDLVLMLIY